MRDVVISVAAALTALSIVGRVALLPIYRATRTVENIGRVFAPDKASGVSQFDVLRSDVAKLTDAHADAGAGGHAAIWDALTDLGGDVQQHRVDLPVMRPTSPRDAARPAVAT